MASSAGVGILLVVVVVIASLRAFKHSEASAHMRKDTLNTLIYTSDLLSELTDAETGQRGYLLTGNLMFLQPYTALRDNVHSHLQQLQANTLNATAQTHLVKVLPLIDAKLAELAHVIELRRHNDMDTALKVVAEGEGKRLMDLIRAQINAFIAIQEKALAQHEAAFQSSMQQLLAIIIVSGMLMVLFALSFSYFMYRRSQQQLKNAVHLKTRHLLAQQEQMNGQLQQSNLALEGSEEKLAVTLNSIGDGVIATDVEGRVTLLNAVAEQLTGWTQAEAIGRPVGEIFHIIHQDTRQPSAIPIMAALAHGEIQVMTNHTLLIAHDGSECIIADSCAPIRGKNCQVIGAVLVFRDVTKESVAKQAVRDSAALIQAILNTVVDGIITFHACGGIIETVNPTIEKMFGYNAAELIGQNFSLLIPELDEDKCNLCLNFNARGKMHSTGLQQEVAGHRKDGSFFALEIALGEMELSGRRYFTGILRDITARKQAEEALFKANALQNAIFNSATFSSIATDEKGIIQIFNVGAERMLGYKAGDVMNKITPADISDQQEVIARAKTLSAELATLIKPGFETLAFKASRGIEDIYELTYLRKDGSRLPAVVSVTALRCANNKIIGYLLIGTDNTQRKQSEIEQKKLFQRAQLALDAGQLGDWSWDAASNLVTLGGRSAKMYGFPERECVTREQMRALLSTEDADYAGKAWDQALVEHTAYNNEYKINLALGEQRWISMTGCGNYAEDGTILGMTGVMQDISERKYNEAKLHESIATAEKANLAKSEFLSSMSHELRTPLNAILGFSQLLETGNPLPTAAQMIRLQEIIKAGWYLLELINEVLDLSLIESGKLLLSPEPVLLVDALLECVTMIEPQAQQHAITMTLLPFDNTWLITADRTRLKQVLLNLLSNAVKYNSQPGTVEVICAEISPNHIRIAVKDSGAGLPAEKLTQLFQPFNRLGQEHGNEEGTGIGLVVTKKLVELMDGSIGVESTVGEGSVFWVEFVKCEVLPAADHATLPIKWLAPVPEQPALYTLLYVEDNPANLMLIEQIITAYPDICLLSAPDANIGMALARAHTPEVILMDINLPGISGSKALKLLRKDPVTAHIPVIALSANAMPSDIKNGLEAGFFRYLTKPIKINEFMKALDEALKHA
ncbi:PAS domain S-box protein [Crenothrix polyspora]|uniref:histidine kinase n=1 Tax=Crenothrix polyspora TaxID=360316 RepID=A0A1R4HI70_9GAMM|nr:PAS domain S-box protein [Crenothrix polyspora]SJM95932.1 putative Histidine kinase [Crenothrix polyspora]